MKIFILLFIPLISLIVKAQDNYTSVDTINRQQILDSILAFSGKDCVYIEYGENPSNKVKKQFDIMESFFLLPQDDLEVLLKDEDPYIKLFAFSAYAKKFPDLAQNPNLDIYSDTSWAWMCTPNGKMNIQTSIADLAKSVYQTTISELKFFNREEQIKKAVKDFILNYSQFPKSYEPISFDSYSFGQSVYPDEGAIPDTEIYEIHHTYKLKDKNGKVIEVAQYFKFNNKFEITIIEDENSNNFDGPRDTVAKWINMYGRELNSKDIEFLGLKSRDIESKEKE